MLVRMSTYLPWPGQPTEAGETIELPDAVAMAYIRTGQAERVEQPKPIEAAAIEPPRSNMTKPFQPQLKRR